MHVIYIYSSSSDKTIKKSAWLRWAACNASAWHTIWYGVDLKQSSVQRWIMVSYIIRMMDSDVSAKEPNEDWYIREGLRTGTVTSSVRIWAKTYHSARRCCCRRRHGSRDHETSESIDSVAGAAAAERKIMRCPEADDQYRHRDRVVSRRWHRHPSNQSQQQQQQQLTYTVTCLAAYAHWPCLRNHGSDWSLALHRLTTMKWARMILITTSGPTPEDILP